MMTQIPFLIVGIPLLVSLFLIIIGTKNKAWAWPMALAALGSSVYCAIATLCQVVHDGPVSYRLGGWKPPVGIEYAVDHLNAFVLVVVSVVAFLVTMYSKESVEKEMKDKVPQFYTLQLLLVTGLMGMTITGDAFNLYVLLEIVALTGYALLAYGQGRSYFSTFNYLIVGSIGACFYLLGVGYLLLKAGTLNMIHLSQLLPGLFTSKAIFVAFVFITVGILAKMAFFPMHSWLPNAYANAPIASACMIAPLVTKVSVYVLLRIILGVFSLDYLAVFGWAPFMVILSAIAIVAGSLFALSQTRLKKMLCYLIIAEVGYMVGGIFLGNYHGITGAIYHIGADALMTACLFMAIGAVIYKTKQDDLSAMKGVFKKMPITSIGFVIGAFSMIGIPPTAGFFSKWYLLSGAFQAAQWPYFVALLFSSLVNVVLFFRLIEIGFFNAMPGEEVADHPPKSKWNEAPITMQVPILISAGLLIAMGLYTNEIVTTIIARVLQ